MRTLFTAGVRLVWNVALRRPPGRGLPSDPERYGLHLSEPACRERTRGVFQAFFTGLETGARRPRSEPAGSESVSPLYLPFFWEGAAMGQSLGRAFTCSRHLAIENGSFSKDEPFSLMKVVGVGFAAGFRHPRSTRRLPGVARRFGNLGDLVQDGYGFCMGLFRWRGELGCTLDRLRGITGPERLSALNGLGRSLWFRFMDRPQAAIEAVRPTDETAGLLGGLGLASVFTFPDALERGYGVADSLDGAERSAFRKGLRIGLFVRAHHQATYLAEELLRQPQPVRDRARADLAVAMEAHKATRDDPRYIYRFHERCLDPGG